MGRRALVIALASLLVIVVGAVLVFVIVSSQGGPQAGPSPEPSGGSGSSTATASASPTPSATPTSNPLAPPPAPVTSLAAAPTPRSVQLTWVAPAGTDLETLVVVRSAGTVVPTGPETGTIVAAVPPTTTTVVDAGLTPGGTFTYGVFVRNEAGVDSEVAGVSVTLPAALTLTPVDVTGDITQLAVDAPLADAGGLTFSAFSPAGPRTVAVTPGAGATGSVVAVVTEPVGAAPGAVSWTYSVANASLRSLAEGAKRDEVFALELRDGPDRLPATVSITLRGINDAPVLSAPMAPQAGIAGEPFLFPIPVGTFTDVDATDSLVLSAGTLPGWLSLTNGQLIGDPGAGDTGTTTVSVTATDPHGASVTADVTIDVAVPLPSPNQAPVPVADDVTFDLGVDPLQTTANVLANDGDPDLGPNALAVVPAAFEWVVNGELAGTYTLDATGGLVLDSGVDADGPLQRLGAGEQATGTITYAVTDGTDTVESSITVTVIGAPAKDSEYGVNKVFVPPTGPERELGQSIHA